MGCPPCLPCVVHSRRCSNTLRLSETRRALPALPSSGLDVLQLTTPSRAWLRRRCFSCPLRTIPQLAVPCFSCAALITPYQAWPHLALPALLGPRHPRLGLAQPPHRVEPMRAPTLRSYGPTWRYAPGRSEPACVALIAPSAANPGLTQPCLRCLAPSMLPRPSLDTPRRACGAPQRPTRP